MANGCINIRSLACFLATAAPGGGQRWGARAEGNAARRGRRRWREAGAQVVGEDGVTALSRRGRRTVMSRPPVDAAVACTVPLWTVAMDDTRARPRPKPSWPVRPLSRVNGRNRRSTMSAGTTAPVLTTRRTDVASWAVVEIMTVPPAML